MRLIDLPKEIFKLPFLEKILASLTYNKKPKSFIARLPPLYKNYPKNSVRTAVRNGIRYELDISDYIEWLVYYGILFEPHDSLYNLAKPGYTVLDVGANIGAVTLNMARIVGDRGEIHSFEPDPFIFSKISKNHSLNAFTNVRLNNVALGATESQAYLAPEVDSNRGGTRIQDTQGHGQIVNVSTVDNYVTSNQLTSVNLIKIDVEGYELKVLKGAKETLQKHKPTLFIELDDNNLIGQGDSAASLIRFLSDVGYQKIEHAENKLKLSEKTDFRNCHFDIIAV